MNDKQIDKIAKKYCGMCGVEDYRAFAREIEKAEREACAKIAERAVAHLTMPVAGIAMRIRGRSNV